MIKLIKVSLFAVSFLLASSALASAGSDQAAINTVQNQVQQLQIGLSSKLAALDKKGNMQIEDLEKSIQIQFDQMNKKIQKVQDTLNSRLNSVQKEVRQSK